MEDADRANDAREADEAGVAAAVERGEEQHRDDETESSSDEEEEDSEEEMEDSDSEDDNDEEEEEEERIPTPEEVEVEYTYPQDFQGRSWQEVVEAGQYFRLIIDPSCTEIPAYKFLECKFLIEIVYPEEGKDSKLLQIGSWAFGNCCNLQRMNPFPNGLVDLGDFAFKDCWMLQGRITIPSSIRFVRGRCFEWCEAITSVVFESSTATTTVLELEHGIFRDCKKLMFVRLPNSLTIIPSDCFLCCCSLIDVPIPGTVRTIQRFAFEHCGALSAVDLPESVIAIDEKAYRGCSVLVRVTIRSSMNAVQVGRDVFEACPSLATIRVVNPLVWSKLLSAMNTDPSFLYKFVRKYEGQIMMHRRSSR